MSSTPLVKSPSSSNLPLSMVYRADRLRIRSRSSPSLGSNCMAMSQAWTDCEKSLVSSKDLMSSTRIRLLGFLVCRWLSSRIVLIQCITRGKSHLRAHWSTASICWTEPGSLLSRYSALTRFWIGSLPARRLSWSIMPAGLPPWALRLIDTFRSGLWPRSRFSGSREMPSRYISMAKSQLPVSATWSARSKKALPLPALGPWFAAALVID